MLSRLDGIYISMHNDVVIFIQSFVLLIFFFFLGRMRFVTMEISNEIFVSHRQTKKKKKSEIPKCSTNIVRIGTDKLAPEIHLQNHCVYS